MCGWFDLNHFSEQAQTYAVNQNQMVRPMQLTRIRWSVRSAALSGDTSSQSISYGPHGRGHSPSDHPYVRFDLNLTSKDMLRPERLTSNQMSVSSA